MTFTNKVQEAHKQIIIQFGSDVIQIITLTSITSSSPQGDFPTFFFFQLLSFLLAADIFEIASIKAQPPFLYPSVNHFLYPQTGLLQPTAQTFSFCSAHLPKYSSHMLPQAPESNPCVSLPLRRVSISLFTTYISIDYPIKPNLESSLDSIL